MKDVVRLGWLFLGSMALIAVLIGPGSGHSASLLESIIYQLTGGSPQAVSRLFD